MQLKKIKQNDQWNPRVYSCHLKCNVVRAPSASSKHHGGDVVHQGQVVLVGERRHLRGGRRRRWRRWWRRWGGHPGGHVGGVQGRLVPCALLMRPQPGELRVRALAHLTLVGPLPGVEADVVAQRGRLAEAPVAEAAHEGLVQGVDAHVGAQVAAGVEAAVADDAAHAAGGGGGGRGAGGAAVRRVRVGWRREEERMLGSEQAEVSPLVGWKEFVSAPTFLVLLFVCSWNSGDPQEGVVGVSIPH